MAVVRVVKLEGMLMTRINGPMAPLAMSLMNTPRGKIRYQSDPITRIGVSICWRWRRISPPPRPRRLSLTTGPSRDATKRGRSQTGAPNTSTKGIEALCNTCCLLQRHRRGDRSCEYPSSRPLPGGGPHPGGDRRLPQGRRRCRGSDAALKAQDRGSRRRERRHGQHSHPPD